MADTGDGEREHTADEIYPGAITPADFVREMSTFSNADIPVVYR